MSAPSDIQWCGRRIEGVVFDLDGTLTDSIEAYYEVFRETTARFGIEVRREDVLEPMAVGSHIWDRAIPKNMPDRNEKINQCMSVIPEVFRKVMERVQPFPGVKTTLNRLRERNLKLGLATSSWKAALQPLHEHSMVHFFKAVLSREDGLPGKPSPAIILECLNRMEVDPSHAVAVGDSPLDIRAGRRGDLLTIAVLSGIGNRDQLEAEKPNAVVEDVTEIPSLFNLE